MAEKISFFGGLQKLLGTERGKSVAKVAAEKLFGWLGRQLGRSDLVRQVKTWGRQNQKDLGLPDLTKSTAFDIAIAAFVKLPQSFVAFVARMIGVQEATVALILNEALDEMVEQILDQIKTEGAEPADDSVGTKIDEIIEKSGKFKKLAGVIASSRPDQHTFQEMLIELEKGGENERRLATSFQIVWSEFNVRVRSLDIRPSASDLRLHGEIQHGLLQRIWTRQNVLFILERSFVLTGSVTDKIGAGFVTVTVTSASGPVVFSLERFRSLMLSVPGAEPTAIDTLLAGAQGALTGSDPLGVTAGVRTRIATMATGLNAQTALSRERALAIDARMHLSHMPDESWRHRGRWIEIAKILVAVIVIFAFAFLVLKYCI